MKTPPAKKELVTVCGLRTGDGREVQVEMAPGEHVVDIPASAVPKVVTAELQPAGDGTYRLVARRRELYIPAVQAAKVFSFDYQSILRLARGKFIDSDRPTPNTIRISVASWFEHQERVRRDPEFWTGKNLQKWRETIDSLKTP